MFFADNMMSAVFQDPIMDILSGTTGHFDMEDECDESRERHVDLPVTLEQCYFGAKVTLPVERSRCCSDCKGKGGKKSGTCKDCYGEGKVIHEFNLGRGMVQRSIDDCEGCDGKGQRMRNKDKCGACYGDQVVRDSAELCFEIPRGTRNKSVIRLGGEGDAFLGPKRVNNGDLIVHCVLQPHDVFRVDKNNLVVAHEVSWAEAITGAAVVIEHLDGRKLFVEMTRPISQSGDREVIKGAGMPLCKAGKPKSIQFGDLVIEFTVTFPERVPIAALQRLQPLLNEMGEISNEDVDMEAEEHCMTKLTYEDAQRVIRGSVNAYKQERKAPSAQENISCGIQ